MILVTRLNGTEVAINADMVKFVEATPDTIITLTTDQKILVRETVKEVIDRIIAYKRAIFRSWVDGPPPTRG